MIDLLRLGFEEGISADGLSDALRRQAADVPAEDVERLAAMLEGYLRGVPDALAWTLGLTKDPRCGRAVAFATGAILTYVFDEEDMLPEASFGTIGLIDDAYLIHGFVAALRRTYPGVEPSGVAYDAPGAHASDVVAALLPEGVAPSLSRTCESVIQVAQALFPPAQDPGSDDLAIAPDIRVAAGVAANGAAAHR